MRVQESMSNAEYHGHPAVGASLLHKIARSPMHARAYLDGDREAQTPAMAFGEALHTAVLEPARFRSQYAAFQGDRRTKAGKDAYEQLQRVGATIISQTDHDAVTSMTESILMHPVAGPMLTDGVAEASVFYDHDLGVECKCRPDYWVRERGLVVDLKTTEDASAAGFARSVVNYRYHVQAAHYIAGTGASRFVFVAVEKKPPYAVAVFELDPDALKVGRALRERAIETYASCVEFGIWPGYPTEVQSLALPAWAQGDDE